MLHSANWPNDFVITSWDNGQYVYCNCLLRKLWCSVINLVLNINFWSSQFSTWPKSQDKKLNILNILNVKIWNILILRCRPLVFTFNKAFYKIKRGLKLVFLPHFLHRFWKKIFLVLNSISWSLFIAWFSLFVEILDSMCIVIICYPLCDVINFEVKLNFFIRLFFYMT